MTSRVLTVTEHSTAFERRDLGLLRVTEARFPPWTRLLPHTHERPVLRVTLDGSCKETVGRRVHDAPPGWTQVAPAGEKHTNRCHGAGVHVLLVEPDPTRADLFEPCTRFLLEARCFEDWGVTVLARRVALEMAHPDDRSGLALEALVLELLSHAARHGPERWRRNVPAWFPRVRERLHAECHRPPRLASLAETAGVHPMHLATVFRHFTGMSIGTYIRRLRLHWCIEQLHATGTPLSEIAHRAGFADQSHFTRSFQRYTGLTPHRYRMACAVKSSAF